MQRIIFIFLSVVLSLAAGAQVIFRTVLKQGPVVVGEPFQVQYVLEDHTGRNEFYPPDFTNFRFVSGPNVHEGQAYGTDGPKKLKNIVYTLEAIRPGRFIIPGASARADGYFIKSDDVWLEVVTAAEAAKKRRQPESSEASAAWLQPGEDPYRKIRENLFLKVTVDKKTCFVGEAVTATFKLYSRLMSRSDIVKNPGFYGFTVQDMIGLNDQRSSAEFVNGKRFDVHTVRKVQLYPLRPGAFVIDPMEVVNKVEFSTSAVNKRPEQKISEGVYPADDRDHTEEYENTMSTPALAITVKPTPSKNRPAGFTGATGDFSVSAFVDKNELAKNEEGWLTITVSGRGNFTQLTEPVVQWPAGIEKFEPRIMDSLDHTQSPLKGTRTFRFSFVSAKPGHYSIPVLSFSFFDPDSNGYKTVSAPAVHVTVSDREKITGLAPLTPGQRSGRNSAFLAWLSGFILFTGIGAWWVWFRKPKKGPRDAPGLEKEDIVLTVTAVLQPASLLVQADDKLFYATLRNCLWNFFVLRLGLTGSTMNNRNLLAVLQQKQVDEKSRQGIAEILQQCDTGIFADVYMETDKKNLLEKAKGILEAIDRY